MGPGKLTIDNASELEPSLDFLEHPRHSQVSSSLALKYRKKCETMNWESIILSSIVYYNNDWFEFNLNLSEQTLLAIRRAIVTFYLFVGILYQGS